MAKSFLRIRPIPGFSSKEGTVFHKLSDIKIECFPSHNKSNSNNRDLKKRVFEFDKILDENSNQETLYNECVQPLLTEFFNGQNVLLFAYGTTSSGKTYTIRGNSKHKGIVPRVIHDVFRTVEDKLIVAPCFKKIKFNEYDTLSNLELRKETEIKSSILNSINDKQANLDDLKFRPDGFDSFLKNEQDIFHIMYCSFLELYNEKPYDLLIPNSTSPTLFRPNSSIERNVQLKLSLDSNGNYYVSGLTQIYVNKPEEAYKVYLFGIDNLKKHTSSTAQNTNSSRSHSIFNITLITLKQKSKFDYHVLNVNNFSLCDLAGQENMKKTKASGSQISEAKNINTSIFTLGNCFRKIRENKKCSSQSPIPFNESYLTKMFKPYLTGEGLTYTIITINPQSEYLEETIRSLEFSAIASEVISYVIENKPSNILKDKLHSLTQLWLSTSKHWSEAQDYTVNQIGGDQNYKSISDDLIVDSQDLLQNQRYDSTFYEEITNKLEKIKDFEDTIVECELYDSEYVDNLLNHIEELEKQIKEADRNKMENLETIYQSATKMHEENELERVKIIDRMNKLMNDRMKNLETRYEEQIDDLDMKIENFTNNEKNYHKQILELTEQLNRYKKDLELIKQTKNDDQIKFEVKSFVENLTYTVDYENELKKKDEIIKYKDEIIKSKDEIIENNKENNKKKDEVIKYNEEINKNQEKEIEVQKILIEEMKIKLNDFENQMNKNKNITMKHQEVNTSINPTYQTEINDYSIGQLSFCDFNKSVIADMVPKRSSLKQDLRLNDDNQHQESNTLFTTNILPIKTNQQNYSTINQTDQQQLKNTEQLLESMIVSKNLEQQELDKIKKQKDDLEMEINQYKSLLDSKDEEIKKMRAENNTLKKEIYKPIKEEGLSIINSNQALITKALYTSVLNHTSIVGNNTPFKPLSQLASNRKKRNIEEDAKPLTSDARYLDFIKNREKSPTTEKKTKKKRTTQPKTNKKVKEEVKTEPKIVEEDELIMDDLIFLVEEDTVKKSKKSRPAKEVTTSVRKRMPLNVGRESFHFGDNDDDLDTSIQDTKKKRNLRTRRKIEYN